MSEWDFVCLDNFCTLWYNPYSYCATNMRKHFIIIIILTSSLWISFPRVVSFFHSQWITMNYSFILKLLFTFSNRDCDVTFSQFLFWSFKSKSLQLILIEFMSEFQIFKRTVLLEKFNSNSKNLQLMYRLCIFKSNNQLITLFSIVFTLSISLLDFFIK